MKESYDFGGWVTYILDVVHNDVTDKCFAFIPQRFELRVVITKGIFSKKTWRWETWWNQGCWGGCIGQPWRCARIGIVGRIRWWHPWSSRRCSWSEDIWGPGSPSPSSSSSWRRSLRTKYKNTNQGYIHWSTLGRSWCRWWTTDRIDYSSQSIIDGLWVTPSTDTMHSI